MELKDEEIIKVLAGSPVFRGVPQDHIKDVIVELGCSTCSFAGQDFVAHAGDALRKYPVLIAGLVEARLPKADGGYTIVGRFGPGESFAEAVPTTLRVSPVDIFCVEESFVAYIPAARLEASDNNDCLRVRANIMSEMSKKISELSYKLTLFAEPRLRNRLLMYLQSQDEQGNGEITLQYNRKELASYLGVNDKALSRELRRMQDEGVIEVSGKHVRINSNKQET
ncbi:Crp/Fnr family transcriptional regulator [Paratractidigestivibacter sp.]|uniref:Crp/Fnr family transcriptional regulator n=2 Tax=Paratractidigestivibacter sp. TaxID=2847316 RepID=UPI002ABE47B9|nr:Crp/Fnr family transcriptional regulator [Paratractidigestivibacter sp.]